MKRVFEPLEQFGLIPKLELPVLKTLDNVKPENVPVFNINPRMPNWFISLESEMLLASTKHPTEVVESGLNSRVTNGMSVEINAGYRLGRWTISSGVGQTSFNNDFVAEIAPQPRLDTISSYYALVTNEYRHFEKTVTLIERRYNTQLKYDSNARIEKISGTSKISYITIPLNICYNYAFNRIEVSGAMSSQFMVAPSFSHSAPETFSALMKQNEQSIRPSLVRPSVDIGVGYRFTSHMSINAQFRKSLTTKSVLIADPKKLNTSGVKLGLMYRF